MNPLVFVTYLCGYALGCALFGLIPATIAKLENENFYLWWFGSFCVLMVTMQFPIGNSICFSPIIILVILSISARVSSLEQDQKKENTTN